jgi:hypothetical protein
VKKQITYAGFVPRIIATTVDLIVIFFVITPITSVINHWSFIFTFKDFAIKHGLNMNDNNAIASAFKSSSMQEYLTLSKIITYTGPIMAAQILLLGLYFILFLYKKSWTPGKFIMRIRVRNAEDFGDITLSQSVRRFVFSCFGAIGILLIPFTQKHQALHDKLAKTVVIKS